MANQEIVKNKKLEEENKKLKEDINKYKNELDETNKLISDLLNNQVGMNELEKLNDEITNLKIQLSSKDNEIQELKNQINNSTKPEEKVNFQDIIVINFITTDGSLHEGIKCLSTDIFAEVEERLYKKNVELRNSNNMFKVNEKPVLRFKTLGENNIKDGDSIQLIKLE